MNQHSDLEEAPYRRPEPNPYAWPPGFVVVLAAIAAAYYWWFARAPEAPPAPVQAPRQAAPAPAPEPAIRYPLASPDPEAAKSLPTLEMSDSMMREALAGLIGDEAFAALVFPSGLVRRIVATVDNLPRSRAPRRSFALTPVPGAFGAAGGGESLEIGAANFARYAPHVRAAEAIDARALVGLYVRTYPLFQRAYEELGYPGRHFNDRLVEAIDDLLAAPEAAPPIRLLQAKVLYEFADPELETRSAGQKILIRMGGDNAARVKAKLREIRRELLAAAAG
jgi:hypothetical protein